jgi:uncharacterized protein
VTGPGLGGGANSPGVGAGEVSVGAGARPYSDGGAGAITWPRGGAAMYPPKANAAKRGHGNLIILFIIWGGMSDPQRAAIDFLSRGEAYGRPGAPVARVDTHASIVFLVGERAYKLKRAIRYSYLDYSTIEKRAAMCRAEYQLNRRTAPSLYLGVRAVTRAQDGSLALDGAGDAVEWLVEMRRFDQEDLFDRLAAGGRLAPETMRDLADEVAAFHAAAEPCGTGHWAAAIGGIARASLANLRATGDALDQGEVAAIAAATEAALARLGSRLEARRSHVRRCHGDLHLRNICLIDGKPTLFDGIEFNDAFTCIDTLYDLAFLLMDLGHRGLGDLAALVFNRYLDRAGDDRALALLPLYLSIRAGVRAHVSIAAGARQEEAREKNALAAEAACYLAAAVAVLRPARPCLVAIGGLSGSGKSSVALGLAPGFAPSPGARVLRSDVARKQLFGVAPETRLPPSAYDTATNRQVYEKLCRAAAAALRDGYGAIADAVFLDPAERAAIARVAAEAGVPFIGLWLDAAPDLLRRRLDARTNDASDADRRVLAVQLGREIGPLNWRRIAADRPLAAILVAARRAIGTGSA